jgi:hypothetical protein
VTEHLVPLAEIETEANWRFGASGIELNGEVRSDWAGRPSVSAETAARLYAELVEERDRLARENEERIVAMAQRHYPVPRGVPAMEGCSAWESMMIASGERPGNGRVSPQQEWFDSIGRPQ